MYVAKRALIEEPRERQQNLIPVFAIVLAQVTELYQPIDKRIGPLSTTQRSRHMRLGSAFKNRRGIRKPVERPTTFCRPPTPATRR